LSVSIPRISWLPSWSIHVIPYLFLLDIGLLRTATGGVVSGYGSLLFLAPFWVALYGNRRQVVGIVVAMFIVQSSTGMSEVGFTDLSAIRRSLLASAIIGMISIAVQRNVQELRDAEARLAAEARDRARTNALLEEQARMLERSNRDLEQFAYVSSHDLQEPLRMIRSFSQLFLSRHGSEVSADGIELLDFVVDGAARAQALVNDLLEYSRVDSSGRPLEPVPLRDSIDRALDTLQGRIEETGASIRRKGDHPLVSGDPGQLDRLFVNLVGNAIKYRDSERAPRIEICTTSERDHVEVTVTDNGIGIDKKHADRVFLMFQRLHGRDQYEGTGIGLAICSRIVERHGGTISADGRPGFGTTFRFTLEKVDA
ncbi:MAG: multi-sensor Signal transduction histidine kinase, partial [Thermoleophilia bacterium]|nr:multi-sensor Signal transduction histidine kinase [Thermoleophilia bacterium]